MSAGAFAPWIAPAEARAPERALLGHAGGWHSARELGDAARCLAAGLAADGLAPGDLLAVRAPAGPAFVAAFHAASWMGVRLLPVNMRLAPAEREAQLASVRPALLLDGPEALAGAMARGRGKAPPAAHTWAGDEIAQVLFTSGTAGPPKAACLSMGSLVWSGLASAAHLGAHPRDRWLACLPLFHVGGLQILARSALLGADVLLHDGFDPEQVSRALDEEEVTLLSLVPTTLKRLLRERRGRPAPPALRAVLLGGAAAPTELVAEARAAGLPVLPTYGLTETASQLATASTGESAAEPPGSVGRPLLGSRIRIVDPSGAALPAGAEGEITAAGPTLFSGYLGAPEATARALREGWLHTGDIGVLDGAGRLRVLERRSDLVVSGGENVHPGEVEAALLAHPAVEEAAVFGAPDPELGARVVAWVVLGAEVEPRSLLADCRRRLAGYKLPREIHPVKALPRGAMGKVRRRRIAAGPPGPEERAGPAWSDPAFANRPGSP